LDDPRLSPIRIKEGMRYLDTDTTKKISKVGLGTWQFGSREWDYGEAYLEREVHAIVRRAVGHGVTLFDTAEIYAEGRSERALGRALGEDKYSVFLATKMFPLVPSAAFVRHRAAASARRLGVGQLDLYQVHWSNPLVGDSPLMRGMRSLQDAGVIDQVGVSSYSLERWRVAEQALGRRIFANQVSYSLVDRFPERDLLPFAEAHGHAIIAYSPLGKGLLSGRFHRGDRPTGSARTTDPLFHPANLDRTTRLMAVLREVAAAHSATPAQIALAWVIHHPAVAAIPGASSVEQLEDNVAAAEIRLAEDEYASLCQASSVLRPLVAPASSSRSSLWDLKHMARAGRFVARTAWGDVKSRSAS
jgi:aryl-alcohol dehydrogenase-like predicted oxidoreductase